MFFGIFSKEQLDRMTAIFDLHYWNEETKAVRIAATQYTDKETVQKLVDLI